MYGLYSELLGALTDLITRSQVSLGSLGDQKASPLKRLLSGSKRSPYVGFHRLASFALDEDALTAAIGLLARLYGETLDRHDGWTGQIFLTFFDTLFHKRTPNDLHAKEFW